MVMNLTYVYIKSNGKISSKWSFLISKGFNFYKSIVDAMPFFLFFSEPDENLAFSMPWRLFLWPHPQLESVKVCQDEHNTKHNSKGISRREQSRILGKSGWSLVGTNCSKPIWTDWFSDSIFHSLRTKPNLLNLGNCSIL